MSVVEKTLRKIRKSNGCSPDGEKREAAQTSPGQPHQVDLGALRRTGLAPAEGDAPPLMAQYRHIKRPLIANATARGAQLLPKGRLIVISSAMPGEGKTFTVVNLARSMSFEKDVHVVLVDADVAKPQLTRMLGAGDAPGLLDALRTPDLDPEGTVLATDVPNLSFIPAGTHSAQATELLASERMALAAEALLRRDRQRILLFDSPPLLLTSESPVLTQIAGQVVLVVRAESTPQPVVLDALDAVEGEAAVYLVLNQSTTAASSYYYGNGQLRSEAASAS